MKKKIVAISAACLSLLCYASASAGTIIKLDLGEDPAADVEYDGFSFSTHNDGNVTTTGDQGTDIDYQGFLGVLSDINSGASFSISDLTPSGALNVFGSSIAQTFTDGEVNLYANTTELLLSADLTSSVLTGPVTGAGSSTGAVFTISFGNVTDGTLKPKIKSGTFGLSISLANVMSGTKSGFTYSGDGINDPYKLLGFTADATAIIDAEPVPEPSSALLASLSLLGLGFLRRQKR